MLSQQISILSIPQVSINASVQAQKKQILSQLKKTASKDYSGLENELNSYFYKENKSSSFMEKVIKIASEEFSKKWENYSLTSGSYTAVAKGVYFLSTKKKYSKQNINKLVDSLEKLFTSGGLPSEKIQSKINEVRSMMQDASTETEVLIKNINDLVAYSYAGGPKTRYGDAFEYPLAAFAAMLEHKGEEVSNKVLKESFDKNLQATNRSKSYISIQDLSKDIVEKLNIKGMVMSEDGMRLEYSNPTQDKIDVSLSFEGEDYNISAKSYRDISEIHILSGSALTQPVLNLSNPDFLNNYFYALYEGLDLKKLHQGVKANILLMSLSGAGSSAHNADTFVVNNKKTRKIYVRSIAQMVQDIVSKNKYNYLIINGGKEIPDQSLRNYKNKGVLPDEATASMMISEMHQQKLNISIKGSILTKKN